MSTTQATKTPLSEQDQKNTKLLEQYGAGPIHFAGTDNGLYERHLLFDNVIDQASATARDRFEAFARSGRDVLSQRWTHTENTYARENPKRIYYLSMEFLIGRSLANDHYMHLADLTSYVQAQERLGEVYANPESWARTAILNVAGSGKFSSDHTIYEYASEIWGVKPCPAA